MRIHSLVIGMILLLISQSILGQTQNRLNGAFINPGYGANNNSLPVALINDYFDELQDLGTDTIILAQTRVTSAGMGCATSPADFEWVSGFPSKLGTILNAAQQRGIQVYVGTTLTTIQCNQFFGNANAQAVKNDVLSNFSTLAASYGSHPAFAGWYISDEPGIPAAAQYPYYQGVRQALGQITPEKPAAVSPFLGSVNQLPSPTVVGAAASLFRNATGIDIQIWQDSIGAFSQAKLFHWDRAGFSTEDYFSALSAQLGSGLWANVELFNNGSPLFNSVNGTLTGAYRPASAQRLNQQLWSGRFAAKRVAWLHQIHLSEVGAPGAYQEGARLQAGYRAVFGIGGAGMLTALNHSNYVWLTPPSPSYPDNGSKMFDRRSADPTSPQDSGWVGVNGSATLRVDLGTTRALDWVGVQTLSRPSWGIRTPTTLTVRCGTTVSNLATVATINAPFTQAALASTEAEEYVLGNYSPIGANCRHVELSMPNSNWTFIGEVELSRD